jgi:hypothetical protein
MLKRGQRFLDLVASMPELTVTVLASSKYPFPREEDDTEDAPEKDDTGPRTTERTPD